MEIDLNSLSRGKRHAYMRAMNIKAQHPHIVPIIIEMYKGMSHSINDIAQYIVKKYGITVRADYITPMMELNGVPIRTHKQVSGMMSKKLDKHGWNV